MRKGITLIEGLVAGGLILLLGVLMLLGVLDARRTAREAARVSSVRQAQAALEAYRSRNASYPGSADLLKSDDAALAQAFGYRPQPEGCGADRAVTCSGYVLDFTLEGRIGTLAGGKCTAAPEGLSCVR